MQVRHFVTRAAVASVFAVMSVSAYADHTWGNYHWERASNPLLLDLGDNVSSTWDGHLDP